MPPTDRGAATTWRAEMPLWLLRGGLAFVLVYAATAMLISPSSFEMYVPGFVRPWGLTGLLLASIAGLEILLAVGLLWRRFTCASAVLTAALMVAIVSFNLDAFHVLFRNVAIACAALSLALQTRKASPSATE